MANHYASQTLTSLNRTFTILFSHTIKAFLNRISPSGFQSGAPSVDTTSKFQNILTIMIRISMYARLAKNQG